MAEPQRARVVSLYLAALGETGMRNDAPFRDAAREHLEFGTRVAKQNPETESKRHQRR